MFERMMLVIGWLLGASSVTYAGALVLDTSGSIVPPVEAFADIETGTVLDLGQDSTLTVAHYSECEEVTITGGIVAVGETGLRIEGARSVARTSVNCPARVELVAADLTNAAVVTRSITVRPQIGLRPEIVFAGPEGDKYDSLKVVQGRSLVTVLTITDRRADWPANMAPLEDGSAYVLFITGEDVQGFGASVVASAGAAGRIVLAP